jgi:hypothetical protein
VARERFQLGKFLKQNGGKLAQPVSLMVFSDQGVKAQPQPSTDGNMLINDSQTVASSRLSAFESPHDLPEKYKGICAGEYKFYLFRPIIMGRYK